MMGAFVEPSNEAQSIGGPSPKGPPITLPPPLLKVMVMPGRIIPGPAPVGFPFLLALLIQLVVPVQIACGGDVSVPKSLTQKRISGLATTRWTGCRIKTSGRLL